MSSQLYDWLVQLPDKPDVLTTRLAHVGEHLSHTRPYVDAGTIVVGGMTLSSQPKTPAAGPLPVTGSAMMFRTATEEEVWKILREDPFAKAGVWDLERATITPYKCAVRRPL
ncbi:hypothetical protein QBC33DRAFT_536726 [Phialemonium atrogriseum]|uniref:YCII-related domain-containing protein n=1 Tax=Phialemonium atrogriseum TaxID=1093897 RepID=A0AAJ0C425_9PEZI|nr:uncharacterized protein QBC33DRAFT_536726 [Phialemonium atrogriseum]KAK1768292.1 hypothetical protein QBC33DRAFT_536726 [Phialemonium atrogriseum]